MINLYHIFIDRSLLFTAVIFLTNWFHVYAQPTSQNFWQDNFDELKESMHERKRLIHDLNKRMFLLQERLDKITQDLGKQKEPVGQPIEKETIFPMRKVTVDGFPQIEKINGIVSIYDQDNRVFVPASTGASITKQELMTVPQGGELIVSFPGKIAARVGENSRIILGPSENGRFEVNLQNGTISAFLDPNRDKENGPVFAIRTKSGVTEATGTFYAVTEYKGQAYTAVKTGKVKKETVPPSKPDFSAYLKKSKSPPKVGQSSKK